MTLSKSRIAKIVQLLCLIFLIVSCASCKDFKWEARPWLGDHEAQELFNEHDEIIKCNHPEFSEMTCFDPQNIAELRTAIDRVNGLTNKQKSEIDNIFRKIERGR